VSEDPWFVWLNWLVAAVIAVAIVFLQGRWLTPNVYTVPLGRCDVDWHVDRGVVAVAHGRARHDQGVAAAGGEVVVGGWCRGPRWLEGRRTPTCGTCRFVRNGVGECPPRGLTIWELGVGVGVGAATPDMVDWEDKLRCL
jgi:hypothetical protein